MAMAMPCQRRCVEVDVMHGVVVGDGVVVLVVGIGVVEVGHGVVLGTRLQQLSAMHRLAEHTTES